MTINGFATSAATETSLAIGSLSFDLPNRQMVRADVADIVQGAAKGFPLPDLLQREYYAWPGTREPWDEKTLNSDHYPT